MPYYVVHHNYEIELPEKPFDLWCRNELWKYVKVEKGAKIEIIGGEICAQGAPASPGTDTDVHPLQHEYDYAREMEKRLEAFFAKLHAKRAADE